MTGLISLLSKGLSRIFSSITIGQHQLFDAYPSLLSKSYIMTTGKKKTHNFDHIDHGRQNNFSVFNILSRFVITFLPRSKNLLISWLQSLSIVILEPKKIKSVSFQFFLIYLPWIDGTKCPILVFWILSSKPNFSYD